MPKQHVLQTLTILEVSLQKGQSWDVYGAHGHLVKSWQKERKTVWHYLTV